MSVSAVDSPVDSPDAAPGGAAERPGEHRARHPAHRVGLLRDLEHPRDVIAHLGPNWYSSIMGTGIVANAAVTLPRHLPGLRTAALTVWAVAWTMLVALSLAWAAHWVRHHRTARRYARNPVMAQFYGAPPMALLTVGAGTLLLGKGVLGESLALRIDLVMWTVGTLAGLVSTLVIPFLMLTRRGFTPGSTLGGWLIPVAPPMLSAATGALLVPHVPAGGLRLALLSGCYAMFALSLLASVVVSTLIWCRVGTRRRDRATTVPTLWIALGWIGQSVTTANLLGSQAHLVLPPSRAAAFEAFGLTGVLPVFAFAVLWTALAAAVTIRTARGRRPFALTWWSFAFPVGTVVTGTSNIAVHTGSVVLAWLAVIFYVVLVGAWAIVAARTAWGSARGSLLLPAAFTRVP